MSRNILKVETAHQNSRRDDADIKFLIFHYTGTHTMAHAYSIFTGFDTTTNPSGRVSPHYMVDINGTIIQYVDEEKRAWHAGVSHWDGYTDINSYSIGIELVNPGHENGYTDFHERQIESCIELAKDIISRHNIAPHYVLGHSDIAPDRKLDPGEKFPWEQLAKEGIGIWPTPNEDDLQKAPALIADTERLRAPLTEWGYDPDCDLQQCIESLQRHFQPEAFTPSGTSYNPNPDTAARLLCLNRLKKDAQKKEDVREKKNGTSS